jgi:hypothetical protein
MALLPPKVQGTELSPHEQQLRELICAALFAIHCLAELTQGAECFSQSCSLPAAVIP